MSADILSGATVDLLSNNSAISLTRKSEAEIPTINNNFPTCSSDEEVLHVLIENSSSGLLNLQSEKQFKNTSCLLPEIGKEKRQFKRPGDLVPNLLSSMFQPTIVILIIVMIMLLLPVIFLL